jgi:hypothetical protein
VGQTENEGMQAPKALYEPPYSLLLAELKSRGLSPRPLSVPANNRTVLLRHDVEFDIRAAERLAEIESNHGISSTFLIAIRSPFFNILDESVARAVRRIGNLGHELGLHFIGDLDGPHLLDRIDRDRELASDQLGAGDLDLVSYHAPGSLDRLRTLLPDAYLLLYRDIIRGHQEYVSDSGGTWRDDLTQAAKQPPPRGIQLLTHPHWWRSISATAHERLCELTALISHIGPDPRLEAFTPRLWRGAAAEQWSE